MLMVTSEPTIDQDRYWRHEVGDVRTPSLDGQHSKRPEISDWRSHFGDVIWRNNLADALISGIPHLKILPSSNICVPNIWEITLTYHVFEFVG